MFITTNNNFADDGTSIKRYYSKPLLTKSLLVTGASVCRTRSVHSVEVAKHSLAHDTEPGGSQWTRHNEPTQLEVNLSHHEIVTRDEFIFSHNSEVGTAIVNG